MAKDKEIKEKLQICVRIRPLQTDEAARKYERALQHVDEKMIILYEQISTKLDALREKRKKEHRFAYDTVFSEKSKQSEVYSATTKNLIPFVLQGFNATVFAYGPTGTGKTFTMVGTPEHPGIMVMALNDLFNLMKQGEEKFTVTMSYLEIYNEHIRDLLVSNSKPLDLWEDSKSGVIKVTGLSEYSTTSTSEVMKLLQKGNQRRSCESTAANQTSSRSHAMLQINIRLSSLSKSESISEQVKTGRLFMVDLAGSERARKTQNVGMRLQEGAHINKSLLALGNVINALAEGTSNYVNFRDSKLTRLLKDALTGNCKTVMIAHVSPANVHREESRNTLIYADKAKNISVKYGQNKLDVSYHVSKYKEIILELQEEIGRLKSKLGNDKGTDSSASKVKSRKSKKKIDGLKMELIETFNEQMTLRKKLMEIDNNLMAMAMEFETQNQVITEYENEKQSKRTGRRLSDDGIDMDQDGSDEDEPEEILEAWEDLVYLHNEQNRYTDMKKAIATELEEKKAKCKEIEEMLAKRHKKQCPSNPRNTSLSDSDENLPKQTSCDEQRELLVLLCKVHELEIQQAEMMSNAIVKEHDLQRRDLFLMRYDRQMAICDKIITKQRNMLTEVNKSGSQELEELYALYKLELDYTNNMKNADSWSDLTSMRSNSVLSLRPDKLPPISNKDQEKLFKPGRRPSLTDDRKPATPLSLSSPVSSPQVKSPSRTISSSSSSVTSLPPIRGSMQGNCPLLNLNEIKYGAKQPHATVTKKRQLKQFPHSGQDILVLRSPNRTTKNEKRKTPLNLLFEDRKGSLPGLNVGPPKGRATGRPRSDGDSPVRGRGRSLPRGKRDLGQLRRGNSLSRIQGRRKADALVPPEGEVVFASSQNNTSMVVASLILCSF